MPPDARSTRQRYQDDDDLDRAIMAGSPFSMPNPEAKAPARNSMPLGDLVRALTALAMVFALVAGIGVVIAG